MPARGLVQSPVLVGRDDYLALAGRRLAEAAGGAGQLLFVAGEAGIGKTRLLGAVSRQAEASAFTVVRAAAFPGDGQSLAGLLLDLAGSLRSAPVPALAEAGGALASRLRELVTTAGDAHHRRRLLIQDVADLLLPADTGTPVLIVLEDVHWADELSLDVLGHLARRLAGRPVLTAAAYRSDELYPRLPMRELRARLVGQRLAEEIRLPRLTPGRTASMTSATLVGPCAGPGPRRYPGPDRRHPAARRGVSRRGRRGRAQHPVRGSGGRGPGHAGRCRAHPRGQAERLCPRGRRRRRRARAILRLRPAHDDHAG